MMKNKPKNIQALLNEHKGFVFEFLVAQKLANYFSIKSFDFIKSIDSDLLQRLENYQRSIFNVDKKLYKQLPLLASETAKFITQNIKEFKVSSVLIGSRSKDFDSDDIILLNIEKDKKFISLKLCKDHAFVNTRSAGIKSFFSSYFINSTQFQYDLNTQITALHERLRMKLFEISGLDVTSMDFSSWTEEGFSSLPGELDEIFHIELKNYYHESIRSIYKIILKLYEMDLNSTQKTFLQLSGIKSDETSSREIVFCLHKGTMSYDLSRVIGMSKDKFNLTPTKILEPTGENAYFLIEYPKMSLQIRVKPMRDFTTPAMKVNCSIKIKNEYS